MGERKRVEVIVVRLTGSFQLDAPACGGTKCVRGELTSTGSHLEYDHKTWCSVSPRPVRYLLCYAGVGSKTDACLPALDKCDAMKRGKLAAIAAKATNRCGGP